MTIQKTLIITLNILAATTSCNDKKGSNSIVAHPREIKENPEFHMKKDMDLQTPAKKNKHMKNQQNYHVSGTDEDGNLVKGEVVIDGKAGLGSLTKTDKSRIEIIVEWSATNNVLIATDEYGYLYRLTITKN